MEAFGLSFERQAKFDVWTVDYYFRGAQLAVEFDGDYWHALPHVQRSDARKDQFLANCGLTVLRIREGDAMSDPAGAIRSIADTLAKAAQAA